MASNRIDLIAPPNTVVLIGRGNHKHEGNRWLRKIVEELFDKYEAADGKADYLDADFKLSRQDIVKEIITAIKSEGGQFLRQNVEVTEKQAVERVTNEFKQVKNDRKKLEDEASWSKPFLDGIRFSRPATLASADITVTNADVLFGKCGEARTLAQSHPGNQSVIAFAVEKEKTVPKRELNLMVRKMIEERGGRVLVKNDPEEPWKVVEKPANNINSLLSRKTKQKKVSRNKVKPDEPTEARKADVDGPSDESAEIAIIRKPEVTGPQDEEAPEIAAALKPDVPGPTDEAPAKTTNRRQCQFWVTEPELRNRASISEEASSSAIARLTKGFPNDHISPTEMSQAASETSVSMRASSVATFSFVSSHDDRTFAELAEPMSIASIDGTDISPLTFQTLHSAQANEDSSSMGGTALLRRASGSVGHSEVSSLTSCTPFNAQMKVERMRGGRMVVGRQTPPLRMLNKPSIRPFWKVADDHSAITMGEDKDVVQLLRRMKNQREDALLQIRCFGDLAEIARLKQISPLTLKEVVDGLKDLIGIMNHHRLNAQVQCHCCTAFGWLASNHPNLKRFISHYGGVEAIVDAMKEHEDDEATQTNGCLALCSLADNDRSNQGKIAAGGGVEVLVRAMQRNPSIADIHEYACRALSSVAMGSISITRKVEEAGSVGIVVSAMRTHAAIEKVQLNGSWALGTLSSQVKNVRDSVVEHGGIATILCGMSLHPKSEEVQIRGCIALLELALKQYLDNFVDAKGVEIVLAAMNGFESNETLQYCGCVLVGKIAEASSEEQGDLKLTTVRAISTMLRISAETWADLNVNNEARKALGRLACNNSLAQKKIAREVVGAMKSARDDIETQANCCSTLETIAKQDGDSRQWIVAAGGIEMIREAQENHHGINELATRALALLTDGVEEVANSTDVDSMVAVINTMLRHTKEERTQEKSLRLLTQILASNPGIRDRFTQGEGLNALITAMDIFPANRRIQGTGCATLYMLFVCNHEVRSSFVRRGGAQVLVNAMRNWQHCEMLQYYACKIIQLVIAQSSHHQRFVYEAGACSALHTAKNLFPMNPGLTRAANKTLSLIT